MKKLLLLSACAVAAVAANAGSIYVNNEVGYSDPHLYSWGGEPNFELFAGWPGAAAAGTQTVDGVEYLKFDVPAGHDGIVCNLIFNNNAGDQVEDYTIESLSSSKDYYLTATATGLVEAGAIAPAEGATIYVDNQVGYVNPALYAWADGLNDPIGGWPGVYSEGTVTEDGVEYYKFVLPASVTGQTLNLIYSGDGASEDAARVQLADYSLAIEAKDYYFVATEAGLTPVGTPIETEKVALYTLDKTGWDEIYVYAYCAEGGPEIFGGWPGTKLTDVQAKDGQTYKTAEVYKTDKEYVLIWNNGKVGEEAGEAKVEVEGAVWTPTAPIAYEVTLDSATEIAVPELEQSGVAAIEAGNEEAVYFNLQGVKVANPEKGLFIKVCAGKSSKVVL